jgi:hypothetical protein
MKLKLYFFIFFILFLLSFNNILAIEKNVDVHVLVVGNESNNAESNFFGDGNFVEEEANTLFQKDISPNSFSSFSELASLRIKAGVEAGKIAIKEDAKVLKEGEVCSEIINNENNEATNQTEN